ncbi:MAG: alpha/beta hydrolase [Dehalococcoidia bacterium]|nr:alpha/beta hydrolase [Dehalococcoidia bacterium]
MTEPVQHYYESQRLRLAYWAWGDPTRPPLVLLHGDQDHARTWDRVARAFEGDYYVVAPDLRGHGDSEWARGGYYSTVEHVTDLVDLIDLLGGLAQVVGHSFGGEVALIAAGAFPEKFARLVDMDGAGARARERLPLTSALLRETVAQSRGPERNGTRVYPSVHDAAARLREANPFLTRPLADHLARWGTRATEGGWVWKFDPWARIRMPVEILPDDVERLWAGIDCPVLHLVGARSRTRRTTFKGQPIDQFFKDSRTRVIPDAGHSVHHDQPGATVDAIRQFLRAASS